MTCTPRQSASGERMARGARDRGSRRLGAPADRGRQGRGWERYKSASKPTAVRRRTIVRWILAVSSPKESGSCHEKSDITGLFSRRLVLLLRQLEGVAFASCGALGAEPPAMSPEAPLPSLPPRPGGFSHGADTTEAFSAAISACAEDGQWDRALSLLTEVSFASATLESFL